MPAHTPGPWTVRSDAATRWPYAVEAVGTVALVAWSEHMDNPDEEPLANARLIAAAPRMLDLLKDILNASYVLREEYDQAVLNGMEPAYHPMTPGENEVHNAADRARAILRDVEGGSES